MVRRLVNGLLEWVTLWAIKREIKDICTISKPMDAVELSNKLQRAFNALDVLAPIVTSMELDLENVRTFLDIRPGDRIIVRHDFKNF